MPRTGHLAENVLHFARLLRGAGLPVGTDRPLLALRALELAGIESRSDLRTVLEACLIDRFEHRALFEQAFMAFWRVPGPPDGPAQGAARSPAQARAEAVARRPAAARRLAEALWPGHRGMRPVAEPEPPSGAGSAEVQPSASDRERLRHVDFESMTAAEWRAASRSASALAPLLQRTATRRHVPAATGQRIDARRLLRDSARHGGDIAALPRRKRLARVEPVIAIVDISGSMSRYSRMFLHFLHALINRPGTPSGTCTAAFVFGTRLTAITRALRARDPDDAVSRVTRCVPDFSGGTRIGACLREFNRVWAKRVPLASATVLLVTDGLERSDVDLLAHEATRLERSCRRVIWLNPLLRYEGFEPQARGVRALLPHAAALLPIHNLESLERLADILAAAGTTTPEMRKWR